MLKNVIVGQSGGPTAVINASLAGVYQAAKTLGAPTVYGMRHGIEGLLKQDYVVLDDCLHTDLDLELLKHTPSSFLGSCRYKLPCAETEPKVYEELLAILEKLNIGAFFYIGGNDSMDTISKLSAYGKAVGSEICFIGVPKTIDNDLEGTDHTPGFGSAAKYIGVTLKEIVRDSMVYDLRSVTVVEIMGRNAGWLTAAACLAKTEDNDGVDFIYLPEVPFNMEGFVEAVAAKQQKKGNLVVAVSEGIRTKNGQYVCEQQAALGPQDAFGHKILTGTARYLTAILTQRLGMKARAIELSTLQRCAAHLASGVDVAEAYQVGVAAVEAAEQGHTGKMVGLHRVSQRPYACVTRLHDIYEIANREKTVPRSWILENGTGVTIEMEHYLRPLVQMESGSIFANGIVCHTVQKL